MTTKEQLLADLRRLTPTERAKVMLMARVIRTAREAGDDRPARVLVAPTLAMFARNPTH